MLTTRIGESETPDMLSKRVARPLCAILRANSLYSAAWLTPGREVIVPDARFCERAAFPCALIALNAPAVDMRAYAFKKGETIDMAARATGLPARVILACANSAGGEIIEGAPVYLPCAPEGYEIITVMPGESFSSLCAGADELKLRALNALWGCAYPGVKLLMPDKHKGMRYEHESQDDSSRGMDAHN